MTKKIGITGIILILICIMLFMMIKHNSSVHETEETSSNDVTALNIKNFDGDIEIVSKKGLDKIQTQLKGNIYSLTSQKKPKVSLQKDGKTLEITRTKEDKNVSFSYELLTLTVSVPQKEYEILTLSTEPGDLQISNISAKQIQADTTDGNIRFNDTFSDKLSATTDHGDINLTTSTKPSELQVYAKTEYGKVTVFGKSSKDEVQVGDGNKQIKLQTNDGDISVTK
jgi:DUF4097 and DUF4098 domain-containing protein YvlB